MDSVERKLAFDMGYVQLGWSLWYIPFVLIGYLVIIPFIGQFADIPDLSRNFMSFIFQPTKIFMLVIGIITYFAMFPMFVKQGVTRKQYFVGSATAAAGVALGINITTAVLTGILQLVSRFTTLVPGQGYTAFLDGSANWFTAILIYSLIIMTYYIAGWLIAIGFSQSGLHGALAIAGAVLLVSLTDFAWEGTLTFPFPFALDISLPTPFFPLSILGNVVVIGIGLWVIRKVTKHIPISVE